MNFSFIEYGNYKIYKTLTYFSLLSLPFIVFSFYNNYIIFFTFLSLFLLNVKFLLSVIYSILQDNFMFLMHTLWMPSLNISLETIYSMDRTEP